MLILAMARPRRYALGLALAGGLCVGLWRGAENVGVVAAYRQLYGKHVQVSGTISQDASMNTRGQPRVQLTNVIVGGRGVAGAITATITDNASLRRSDDITVEGVMAPGYGNIPAAIKQARLVNIQREVPGDVALRVRDEFAQGIQCAVGEPAASLGSGFLLGQKRALPASLQDALKVVGLTHIVVASGYNLMILVRLCRRAFQNVSKFLSVATSGMLVAGFVAVTGMSPSMSRAALVAGLGLYAWYYGHTFHPVTLLLTASAVTLLVNPAYGWNDLGWMLSFASFAGVMIIGPIMTRFFYGQDKPGFVAQLIIETIAAQVLTLPIILVSFGQLPYLSLIMNVLIVPFVPLGMLLTCFAGLGALALPHLAGMIGWPAQTLLNAMVQVITRAADLPGATAECKVEWWMAFMWGVCVLTLCWIAKWRMNFALHAASVVE